MPPLPSSSESEKKCAPDFAQFIGNVLENMTEALATVDFEWRITYVNRAYMRLVTPIYSKPDQLIGANLWERFPDIGDSIAGQQYRIAMKERKRVTFEHYYPPLQLWAEVQALPFDHGLTISVYDITTRKQQELQLAELTRTLSEQSNLFDAILSNVRDLAYAFDHDLRFLYVNRPLAELLGRPLEAIVGQTCRSLGYPPAIADQLEAHMREVFATGRAVRGEAPLPSHSGKIEHHEYIYSPVFGPDGQVEALVGTTRLITERKRDENVVRQAERQLRLVSDHASVLLAHLDRDYRYQFVNVPYADRFSLKPSDIVGKTALEVQGQAAFASIQPHFQEALTGRRVEFEVNIAPAGSPPLWHQVVYTPERDSSGEVVGVVAAYTDITLRRNAEIEAMRARDEAIAAGRAKDEFLAALSHELRTPLNPVLLIASESASDPALPADLRDRFDTIAKNVRLEARLIDDLLDLTRITRGKMSLQMHPVDVHVVLNDTITTLSSELTEHDLTLTLDLHAKSPVVNGDPARLQQIFWNVLKNAVKFTPAGGEIAIRSSIEEKFRLLRIEISDTGIGITPEELSRIFESFRQGEHASSAFGSHRFGGLGLGLSISRQLASLHGGTIEAQSVGREQGSTFILRFPLCDRPAAPTGTSGSRSPMSVPVPPPRFNRVLLVEDHDPTRKALMHLLARRHYQVVSAKSMNEALQLIGENAVDFIISDIGLPDGSGHDLMAQLRDTRQLKGIALSGYGMDRDIMRGREAGFSAHLIKPIDIQSLDTALAAMQRELTR